ncbi:hypothetical protein ACHAW6_008707 [Cyclotella cf. meneghiniana]
MTLGGFHYALILVDVATQYTWIYGMQTVSSADIILALESFKADASAYPKTCHADFDQKLIGGDALRHINRHSRIIAAPARQQSSNGLVEATWKTIVWMARAYITEKQVSREFWYFAVRHTAIMINQIPGHIGGCLTTPEPVYGTKPDSSTGFELFSICYFDHKIEGAASKSNTEVQTLAGIAVRRCEKSNTIQFYNPLTRGYYSPPVFKLDKGQLPISLFPTKITFDGGIVCGLQSNNTDPAPELFPPGTQVNVLINCTTQRGTIQHGPMPPSPILEDSAVIMPEGGIEHIQNGCQHHTILLDDNTTTELTFQDLLSPATESSVNPAEPEMDETCPHMTPYTSGIPINSIPPLPKGDPDQKRRTQVYQSIVGCINWVATCTHPDIAPALTFLASYDQNPSHSHYQAALQALKYLYSTAEYGISYHSDASNTIQAFNHFPSHHDNEANTDATPSSPGDVKQLTSFSNACWGGQFGNAIPDGTPLKLFKFCSISGYVICRTGQPISWKSIRLNRTSLSSCEAEIVATSECMTELKHIHNRALNLSVADAHDCITVYNDNDACIQ